MASAACPESGQSHAAETWQQTALRRTFGKVGGHGVQGKAASDRVQACAFAFLRALALMSYALASTQSATPGKLSPWCYGLEPPPELAASPQLDLSQVSEPLILTDMLKTPWSPPASLLAAGGGQGGGRMLRVDVTPLDCREAPRKLRNGTLIAPATLPVALGDALDLLRRGHAERGFHAYVRHLALDAFPEVAALLPTARALKLAGPRLQSVNLWVGDGGMRSNLHWDGHDNILLQLVGTKTLLLLPPEAAPHAGFVPFAEHRYLFNAQAGSFSGYSATNATVENHALFDALDGTRDQPPESMPPSSLARARVATIRPGEALFLPALWSHAVVSSPATAAQEGGEAAGLNMAVNIWFTQQSASHAAALAAHPAWPQGWFVYGNDLRSAARHDEAAEAYRRALALRPDYFDAAHNLASVLDAQGQHAAAEAQYRRALAMQPADAQAHGNLGIVLRRQGRLQEAAAACRAAIALQPAEARGFALLGNVLAMQERLGEADSALARALALQPRDAKSLNSRGVVLQQLGRLPEALAAFERAVAVAPAMLKAVDNLGALQAAMLAEQEGECASPVLDLRGGAGRDGQCQQGLRRESQAAESSVP